VTASSHGAGTPTGNVTVSDGAISCTGTVAAGQSGPHENMQPYLALNFIITLQVPPRG
jgi:microcystin-dependent protein